MSQPTAIVFGVGSARGVGGAVCKRFAREGYHVIVAGRTLAKIEGVVADIATSSVGSAEALPTDVTDEKQVIAAFDRAMAPGPGREPADVVVSNAGNNALIDFTTRLRRSSRTSGVSAATPASWSDAKPHGVWFPWAAAP